jgi:flagellar hook protein FlgE
MFSAISGLKVHQAMLDVSANDISNVNTIGYKGSRMSFKDALAQQQRSSSARRRSSAARTPSSSGSASRSTPWTR